MCGVSSITLGGSLGGISGGDSLFFSINVTFSMPSGKSSRRIGKGRGGARIETLKESISTSLGNLPAGKITMYNVLQLCMSFHM